MNFCITRIVSTLFGLKGEMPVASKLDMMFSFVKAESQAERKRPQNSRLFILTSPRLWNIRSFRPFVYALASGENRPTSRGCRR